MEQEDKEDSCGKLSRLQIIHSNLSLCKLCIYNMQEENIEELFIDDIDDNVLTETRGEENVQAVAAKKGWEILAKEIDSGSEEFRRELKVEETLQGLRMFVNRKEQGYYWCDGMLKHCWEDSTGNNHERLVVPRSRSELIFTLAHTNFGHLSHKKVVSLIKPIFTWPGMRKDIRDWCHV